MHRRTLTAIIASMILMVSAGAAWSAAGLEVAAAGSADQSIDKQDAFGLGSRIAPPTSTASPLKAPVTDVDPESQPAKPAVGRRAVSRQAGARPPAVAGSRALTSQPRRVTTPEPPVNARIIERTAEPSRALNRAVTVPRVAVPRVQLAPLPVASTARHRPDKIRMMEDMERREKSSPKSGGSTISMVFSTILKLGVVAALMYGALLALKAISGKKPLVHRSAGKMKLMDTVQLSPNSSVHLVKVDGKTLLIGCATGQVNLLQEIQSSGTEEETVEESNGKFAEYLAKYSEGSTQGRPAVRLAGLIRDCTDQLHRYQERLRGSADAKAGEGRRDS